MSCHATRSRPPQQSLVGLVRTIDGALHVRNLIRGNRLVDAWVSAARQNLRHRSAPAQAAPPMRMAGAAAKGGHGAPPPGEPAARGGAATRRACLQVAEWTLRVGHPLGVAVVQSAQTQARRGRLARSRARNVTVCHDRAPAPAPDAGGKGAAWPDEPRGEGAAGVQGQLSVSVRAVSLDCLPRRQTHPAQAAEPESGGAAGGGKDAGRDHAGGGAGALGLGGLDGAGGAARLYLQTRWARSRDAPAGRPPAPLQRRAWVAGMHGTRLDLKFDGAPLVPPPPLPTVAPTRVPTVHSLC